MGSIWPKDWLKDMTTQITEWSEGMSVSIAYGPAAINISRNVNGSGTSTSVTERGRMDLYLETVDDESTRYW